MEYVSVTEEPAMFWSRVVDCVWIILNHGPKANEIQLRLLEEIKDTFDVIRLEV